MQLVLCVNISANLKVYKKYKHISCGNLQSSFRLLKLYYKSLPNMIPIVIPAKNEAINT